MVADEEVPPSDLESAHLVLFGTRETNSLIARFSDRLPLRFTGAAEDYSLAYVFPIGARYVLVNSGLPWWQAPAGTGGSRFANQIAALHLLGRQDYILFDRISVLAEGRFDHEWRLPADDALLMRDMEAVEVMHSTGG